MALRNNGTARSARRIAIFALIFDIVSFGFQGGLIFVAIGHDANSAIECTSTNGLCGSTAPNPTMVPFLGLTNTSRFQSGTATCTIAAGLRTSANCGPTFAPAFDQQPSVSATLSTASTSQSVSSLTHYPLYFNTNSTFSPISFDKSVVAGDSAVNGTTANLTPAARGEFAVINIYFSWSGITGTPIIKSVTDTQGSGFVQVQSANSTLSTPPLMSQWVGRLPSTSADTLNVTLGDNGTVGYVWSLYQNVASYGYASFHTQNTSPLTTDSIGISAGVGDWIVGGTVLSMSGATAPCPTYTIGTNYVSTGTDTTACNLSPVFQFDQQYFTAPSATVTFTNYVETWSAPGAGQIGHDGILAVELTSGMVNSPRWNIGTSSWGELFGSRIYETNVVSPQGYATGSFGLVCTYTNATAGVLNISVESGDFSSLGNLQHPFYTATGVNITGTAAKICNGQPTIVTLAKPGLGGGQTTLFRITGKCTSGLCGNSVAITMTTAWFQMRLGSFATGQAAYGIAITNPTRTSVAIIITAFNLALQSTIVTVFWQATVPVENQWNSQPIATTELFGKTTNRLAVNLTGYHHVQLTVTVTIAGGTSAKLWPQYSLNSGVSWVDLCGAASGNPNVVITAVGPVVSVQCTIDPPALISGVWLRMVGSASVATGSPAFTEIDLLVS